MPWSVADEAFSPARHRRQSGENNGDPNGHDNGEYNGYGNGHRNDAAAPASEACDVSSGSASSNGAGTPTGNPGAVPTKRPKGGSGDTKRSGTALAMQPNRTINARMLNQTEPIPLRQIRALYDDRTIRVYQAYSDSIADTALARGTFLSPPFKLGRMTWIKPSFLWMMYRSGWGLKDAGQTRILGIDISREGFEWALTHSCPSHPDEPMSDEEWQCVKENAPARIQWDPERDLLLRPQPHRTIQIGLSKQAVDLYVRKWIQRITDVTPLARSIHALVNANQLEEAQRMLPLEEPYHYSADTAISSAIFK